MSVITPRLPAKVPSLRDIALVLVIGFLVVSNGLPRVIAFAQDGSGPRADTSLGNSFTYQGRLQTDGVPADGQYDFEFALFDQLSGGLPAGSPSVVQRNDLQVTNGLFTTELDFGASAFKGSERYLEVRVRPGTSTGAYQVLGTRTELTATPYALHAKTVDWSGIANIPAGIEDGDHIGETWTKTAAGAEAVLKAINASPPASCAGTCIALYGDGGSSIYGLGVKGNGGFVGVDGTSAKYGIRGSTTGLIDAAGVYGSGIIGVEGASYHQSAPATTTEIGVKGSVTGGTGCDNDGEGYCYGVYGLAPTVGSQAAQFGGIGVFGEGGTAGVFGKSADSHGVRGEGVEGIYGTGSYAGVEGSGTLYGVIGRGNGVASAVGVLGSGTTRGVQGFANSLQCTQFTSNISDYCVGVMGDSSTAGVASIGVWGKGRHIGLAGEGGTWAGYFTGNVGVTGQINPPPSDARLKSDIADLDEGLETVLALRPVTFAWNDPAPWDEQGRKHAGLIAQEVREVFPSAIYEDEEGMLRLDEKELIPLLINAIQEQQAQIDALTSSAGTAMSANAEPSAGEPHVFGVAGLALGLVASGATALTARRRHAAWRSEAT